MTHTKITQKEIEKALFQMNKFKSLLEKYPDTKKGDVFLYSKLSAAITKLGYFKNASSSAKVPKWECCVDEFQPIHARKAIELTRKKNRKWNKNSYYKTKLIEKEVINDTDKQPKQPKQPKQYLNPKLKYRVVPVFEEGVFFTCFKLQYKSFLKWKDTGVSFNMVSEFKERYNTQSLNIKY